MNILNQYEHRDLRVIQNLDPYALSVMGEHPVTIRDLSIIPGSAPVIYDPRLCNLPLVLKTGNDHWMRQRQHQLQYRACFPFFALKSGSFPLHYKQITGVEVVSFVDDPECLSNSLGERLFDIETGAPTELLKTKFKALRRYNNDTEKTVSMMSLLAKIGALMPDYVVVNGHKRNTSRVNMVHVKLSDDLEGINRVELICLAEKLNSTIDQWAYPKLALS